MPGTVQSPLYSYKLLVNSYKSIPISIIIIFIQRRKLETINVMLFAKVLKGERTS